MAIHLRENVHLTRSLNPLEMSSTRQHALWQLTGRLGGGLVRLQPPWGLEGGRK